MEVNHHGRREIHVRALLLNSHDISIRATTFTGLKAKWHPCILTLVIAFHNFNSTNLLQRTKIYFLMFL